MRPTHAKRLRLGLARRLAPERAATSAQCGHVDVVGTAIRLFQIDDAMRGVARREVVLLLVVGRHADGAVALQRLTKELRQLAPRLAKQQLDMTDLRRRLPRHDDLDIGQPAASQQLGVALRHRHALLRLDKRRQQLGLALLEQLQQRVRLHHLLNQLIVAVDELPRPILNVLQQRELCMRVTKQY